jgi:hypothetical protein
MDIRLAVDGRWLSVGRSYVGASDIFVLRIFWRCGYVICDCIRLPL